MNRIKRLLAPTALSASLCTALATGLATALGGLPATALAADAPAVTLNMLPLPNSAQRHEVNMTMRMDMTITPAETATEAQRAQIRQGLAMAGMPMTMNTQMLQRVNVGRKAADGSMPLVATLDTVKAEMSNANGMTMPLPTQGQQLRFDATLRGDRFEDVRLSGSEQLKAVPPALQERMFRQTFDWMSKFNGKQLRPGESVEAPLDLDLPMAGPAAGNAKFLAKYTLVEVKRGVAVFDVDVGMDMAMSVPLPAPAASAASAPASAPDSASSAAADASSPSPSGAASSAPDSAASSPAAAPRTPAKADITGTGKGRMDFRLADRIPLRSTMNMVMKMNMLLPDGNTMLMDMTMAMDGKASSVKPTAVKAAPKAPAKAP